MVRFALVAFVAVMLWRCFYILVDAICDRERLILWSYIVRRRFGKVHPATVVILTKRGETWGQGLGFVIGKNLILTAKHAVLKQRVLGVIFSQNPTRHGKVRLLATAPGMTDLALLEADTGNIPPVRIAKRTSVGEKVWWDHVSSKGMCSRMESEITEMAKLTLPVNATFACFARNKNGPLGQAPGFSCSGNSGGPVFNRDGDVVGVIMLSTEEDDPEPATCFVRTEEIRRFLASLKK